MCLRRDSTTPSLTSSSKLDSIVVDLIEDGKDYKYIVAKAVPFLERAVIAMAADDATEASLEEIWDAKVLITPDSFARAWFLSDLSAFANVVEACLFT